MTWDGPLESVSDVVQEIPSSYRGRDGSLRMRVPGRIIADSSLIQHIRDDLALEQVANVASLPGIVGHSLAMPDIHWGYGFPIGGVAAFDPDEGGVVSPGGVGFDINCGVRLLATDLRLEDVGPRLREVVEHLFAAVPCGLGSRGGQKPSRSQLVDLLRSGAAWAVEEGYATPNDRRNMEERGCIAGAEPEAVGERAMVRGSRSLGSLGSGNHFLELQSAEEILDADSARAYGVEADQVMVMIHTGSRGLGHQVCQDFLKDLQPSAAGLVDRQLAYAPLGSKQAQRYLGAMAAAANFAFVNRSILTAHTRTALERLFGSAHVEVVYDVCHNIAKFEEHTIPGDGRRKRVLVHRKGATRAVAAGHPELCPAYEDAGQPVVVPGDMGRASYLLAAQEGAMRETFASCCHGAGRRLSRTAAKKQYDGRELIEHLWKTRGIVVRAAADRVAAEEAPEAYKDVSDVVGAVERAGLAKRVVKLRPLGVVKG